MQDTSSSTNNPYPGVNVPDKIIVHHTAYQPDVYQYPLVNQWHKDRGFPLSKMGSYVGYHYLIEKDGMISQCRDEGEGGAHTRGENFTSIGVCLAGNFDEETPTAAQCLALTRLLYTLVSRITTIPKTAIYPHRHFNNTGCYGKHLDDTWAASFLTYLDQHNTDFIIKCGEETLG